ncbi:hypothetical protein DSECCO2_489710 [anaerobic digester metagenome]
MFVISPTLFNSPIIDVASPPIPLPYPVIPAVKLACKLTESLYNSIGTVVKRLTAIKPLIAFKAASFMLPLPY